MKDWLCKDVGPFYALFGTGWDSKFSIRWSKHKLIKRYGPLFFDGYMDLWIGRLVIKYKTGGY